MKPTTITNATLAAVLLGLAAAIAGGCTTSQGSTLYGPMVHTTDRTGTFHAQHNFTIEVPAGAKKLDAWFPMPQKNDPANSIQSWKVEAPHETRVTTDSQGNQFVHLHADNPTAGPLVVKTSFTSTSREVRAEIDPAKTRAHTEAEKASLAAYLRPTAQGAADDRIRALAADAVGDDTNPITASRKIYDVVLERVDYHVKDPKTDKEKTMKPSGKGSSIYTYEQCTGNCSDFHSLYAAMSQSVGIPVRWVFGSFFKGPLAGVDKDQSYHCWVEFHAPEIGWIPIDVAVADMYVSEFTPNENSRPRADLTVADGYHGPDAKMIDYYFGNLEERRVIWHRGRDLVMSPPQMGDPLLWNATGYAEIDGAAAPVTRKLTFTE